MNSFSTLARLIAPLGIGEFMGIYYDKKPIHLRGDAKRPRDSMSTDRLCEMLHNLESARGQVFMFPFSGGTEAADPVAAYLEAGYPVIWNSARGASSQIDLICAELGDALQAHVWPNIYSTGSGGAPLNMHFDPHELLIVQCEGEKQWHISSLRANRPLDVEEMRTTVHAGVEAARELARCNIFIWSRRQSAIRSSLTADRYAQV